ncbi:MAG: hypothetical protein EOM08_14920, partial [Clostridia bacterium]|nr:hypothetical protein [Clostridia bacterium]
MTLTAAGATAATGVDKYQYSLDQGANWQDCTGSAKNQVALTAEGEHTILFKAESNSDPSNQVSSREAIWTGRSTVRIDRTSPTVVVSGNPTEPTAGPITLTATASDANLSAEPYQWGAAAWSASNQLTVTANGTYTVTVRDAAGNTASATVVVTQINPALQANVVRGSVSFKKPERLSSTSTTETVASSTTTSETAASSTTTTETVASSTTVTETTPSETTAETVSGISQPEGYLQSYTEPQLLTDSLAAPAVASANTVQDLLAGRPETYDPAAPVSFLNANNLKPVWHTQVMSMADWADIQIAASVDTAAGKTAWEIENEQELLLLSMAVNSGSATYNWTASPSGSRLSDQYPYDNLSVGQIPYLMTFFAYASDQTALSAEAFRRFTMDKGTIRLKENATYDMTGSYPSLVKDKSTGDPWIIDYRQVFKGIGKGHTHTISETNFTAVTT